MCFNSAQKILLGLPTFNRGTKNKHNYVIHCYGR